MRKAEPVGITQIDVLIIIRLFALFTKLFTMQLVSQIEIKLSKYRKTLTNYCNFIQIIWVWCKKTRRQIRMLRSAGVKCWAREYAYNHYYK
jgi:hypothetical protein